MGLVTKHVIARVNVGGVTTLNDYQNKIASIPPAIKHALYRIGQPFDFGKIKTAVEVTQEQEVLRVFMHPYTVESPSGVVPVDADVVEPLP